MNNQLIIDTINQIKEKACKDAFLQTKKLLPKKISEEELKNIITNFAEKIDYKIDFNNKSTFFIKVKVYSDTLNKLNQFLRRYNA